MSNGSDIAAEVAAALADGSSSAGDGPLVATIVRRGAMTGPEYAPVYGPDTQHTCNVIVGSYSLRERVGTSIEASDLKVMASALDIEPNAADRIVIDGKSHEIVSATPTKPGGVVLYWTIQARA